MDPTTHGQFLSGGYWREKEKKIGQIPLGWDVFWHILPLQVQFHREKSFGRVLSVTSFYPGDK